MSSCGTVKDPKSIISQQGTRVIQVSESTMFLELVTKASAAVAEKVSELVIDMVDVVCISSSILGALVAIDKITNTQGIKLTVKNVDGFIKQQFEKFDLTHLITN